MGSSFTEPQQVFEKQKNYENFRSKELVYNLRVPRAANMDNFEFIKILAVLRIAKLNCTHTDNDYVHFIFFKGLIA